MDRLPPALSNQPKNTVRLAARITRAQADQLEVRDNGTVRVPVELYRIEKPPKTEQERKDWRGGFFYITKEFVENTFPRWNLVPMVDDHMADWDAVSSHVGGFVEVDKIKGREKATLGWIESDPTPMGQQLGGLIQRHVAWAKEGKPAVIGLSISATNVVVPDDVDFFEDQPPFPIIDGDPHHVMVTIAGMQAQENAGISMTRLAQDITDYFGDDAPFTAEEIIKRLGADDPSEEDDEENLIHSPIDNDPAGNAADMERTMTQEELDKANAALEEAKLELVARDGALEKAKADLDAVTSERDGLNTQIEDAEKARLIAEITQTYEPLDEDVPDLSSMSLAELRAEDLISLRKHRDQAATLGGRSDEITDADADPTDPRAVALKKAQEDGTPFSMAVGRPANG